MVLQFKSNSFYCDLGSQRELQNNELLGDLLSPIRFLFIGELKISKYLGHKTRQINHAPCLGVEKGTAWGMSWSTGTEKYVRMQSHRGISPMGGGPEGSGGFAEKPGQRHMELGLGRMLERLALLFFSILSISPKIMSSIF